MQCTIIILKVHIHMLRPLPLPLPGIIFSSQAIKDEDDLSPSARSLSLPQMKPLSLSHDIIGAAAINSNEGKSLPTKPASGYQMGVGMGEGVRGEEVGVVAQEEGERAPSSRDLLKVRQKKKVSSVKELYHRSGAPKCRHFYERGILILGVE